MHREMSAAPHLPVYFDRMIDAFHAGATGRHAHLGHWDLRADETPDPSQLEDPDALEQAQGRLNTEMIRLAKVTDGATILDVACGFGGLVQQLDELFDGLDVTGLNIDVRQLEICQRLHSANGNALRWLEADACDLPFDDAAFDLVFCIEAMFHFTSRHQFLSEARRVLRPGGMLLVTDVVLVRHTQLPLFCIDAVLNDGYGPWPDPWCDHGDAGKLLQSSGAWEEVRRRDATQNTLPSYRFILPGDVRHDRDPGDAAARSAMLLQWLHTNHLLRYDYVSAVARGVS